MLSLFFRKRSLNFIYSELFHISFFFQYAAIKLKVDVVQILLGVGSDTNTLDAAGRTPMTNVIRQCVQSDGSIPTNQCMTIIVMLLQAECDLNMTTCEECCPVMVSSLIKCEFLVRFFLDHGADPGIRCKLLGCKFIRKISGTEYTCN